MQRYTLAQVDALCAAVAAIEESDTDRPSESGLSAIRQLTEALVWSDQHSEALFDRIIAQDFMNVLERIVTNALVPTRTKMHVLHCVTILIMNLRRVSSVYLLCSNNHLNRMIAIEVDEQDDETVSLYVSFLKSLAVRLNESTVQFFYEASTHAFPLFDKAVELLESGDAMVRTAARQIVLSLARLREPAVRQFVLGALPEVICAVVNSLHRLLLHLTQLTTSTNTSNEIVPRRVVQQVMEDIVDDVLYVNDLASATQSYAAEEVMALVEQHLLQPVADILLSQAQRSAQLEDEDKTSSDVWHVAARPALALVVHWLSLSDAPPLLRPAIKRLFLQTPTTNNSDSEVNTYGGVVGVVLHTPCPELYDGVLTLLLMLYNKEKNSNVPLSLQCDDAVACLAEKWSAVDAGVESNSVINDEVKHTSTSTLHDFVQHVFLNHVTGAAETTKDICLVCSLLTMLYHMLQCPASCRVRTLYSVLEALHGVISSMAASGLVPASLPHTLYAKAFHMARNEFVQTLDACAATTASHESLVECTLYTMIKQCWPLHIQLCKTQPDNKTNNKSSVFDAFLPLPSSASFIQRLRPPVPLEDRLPFTQSETSRVACMTWLCLSYYLAATTVKTNITVSSSNAAVDPIRCALVHSLLYPHPPCPYHTHLHTHTTTTTSSSTSNNKLGEVNVCTPCEVVSVVKQRSSSASELEEKEEPMSHVPCGTLVDLHITSTELLLLQPTHQTVSADEEDNSLRQDRVVLCAFDLDCIQLSLHVQRPFCLVLVHTSPSAETMWHLVVRRACVAQKVIQRVQNASQKLQHSALALCRDLMSLS